MSHTLEELNKVFCTVFMKQDLVLTPATDASQVEGWDSLTHMVLISETEKHFGIHFTFDETMSFHQVGDILKVIDKHLRG